MAQTVEFMLSNVAYTSTVCRTGELPARRTRVLNNGLEHPIQE